MPQLNFNNLFFSDAKEILSICYEADRAGAYINEFFFAGSSLNAKITKNEKESKDSIKGKFDVSVMSNTFFEVTLKEMFDDYAYAIKD